jgi:hypothetical protein
MIALVDSRDNVIVLLEEKKATAKPLVAGANPAAASFYIRGPRLKGWHLGQK